MDFEVRVKRVLCVAALLLAIPNISGHNVKKASTLALTSIEGQKLLLSNYAGKVVLLNFWATWCPPCRAEMPALVKMQREYGKRGLQVVGITYPPESAAEVRSFAKEVGVNYPIALGTKETRALFDEQEALPLTIVIDRRGNVRERIEGILLAKEFEQKIKPLLQ